MKDGRKEEKMDGLGEKKGEKRKAILMEIRMDGNG